MLFGDSWFSQKIKRCSPLLFVLCDPLFKLLLGEEFLCLAVGDANDDLVRWHLVAMIIDQFDDHRDLVKKYRGPLPMDMEAGRAKVRRYKNSISRRSHRREKARGLQLNRVKVCERLLAKALHNVLVVLHHVRRHGAVEGAGHLDSDHDDPDDVERCRKQ